jgi:hypothetical protein
MCAVGSVTVWSVKAQAIIMTENRAQKAHHLGLVKGKKQRRFKKKEREAVGLPALSEKGVKAVKTISSTFS